MAVEIDAPHWRAYLFEVHSEETLRAWARRLQLFRFCRAYGGHANDGDSLLGARDVGLPRVEPPLPSRHCVCPAFYPALFA